MLESIKTLQKICKRCEEEKKSFENILETKRCVDKEYLKSEIQKVSDEIEFIKKVFSENGVE
jgi:predicted nucleotidyltransferase